jgi:transcriptional regulator with XRE-family HTH domain
VRDVKPRERFAENLRRRRLETGLSQEALASLCRLHRTEISLLERGVREPRLSTIVRLARALDVPPAALLEDVR